MSEIEIIFPENFEENEWEIEAKGYILGVILNLSSSSYELNFYDPIRLQQDIFGEMEHCQIFAMKNLVVVEEITRDKIEKAAKILVESKKLSNFLSIVE